jgi:hypothetical protein
MFLSSITTSQASFDGIMLGDYSRRTLLYHSLIHDPSLQLLEQIIVLPKQAFDQKEAAAMIERIDSLSFSLLNKINQHGIKVKLFTGKLTDNPTAKQLAGQVPRGYQNHITWDDVPGIGGSKVVLAKIGSSETGKGHSSVNLELHELAHSVDKFVLGDISRSKEFQRVWEKEHEQLFPGNSYFLYPEEYFAETFAMFYLNSETKEILRNKAPLTYQFIEKQI